MLWSSFARRYMFSPKSHSVINTIAWVSLVAVAVPTAAMILLMAIFDGLTDSVEQLNSAVDADIEIVAERGTTFPVEDIDLEAIRQVEGVVATAPYVEQCVMAVSAGRRVTFDLRGVDRNYYHVVGLSEYIYSGGLNSIFSGDIILGASLASSLGAYGIGTEIELYALNRKQISTLLPLSGIKHHTTHLGGVILANTDISQTLALAELERTQRLLNYEGRLSAVAIKIAEGAESEQLIRELKGIVGEEYRVVTRDQKNASINAILKMEKFSILLIGALIILIATFSIVGSVIMLITEKQRDIATLRALGAKQRLITNIFVGEGALLAVAGCLIGTLLGSGIALLQQHFGLVKIPGDRLLGSYPVDLNLVDVITVVAVVLTMGVVVSWLTVRTKLKSNKQA